VVRAVIAAVSVTGVAFAIVRATPGVRPGVVRATPGVRPGVVGAAPEVRLGVVRALAVTLMAGRIVGTLLGLGRADAAEGQR
jgi:hypothetical protein